MKDEPLEAGLLSTFQVFLAIQLGVTVLYVLAHMHLGVLAGCPLCALGVSVGGTLLLIGYLSWPWLRRRLGGYYLPLALALTVFLSLLIQGEILQNDIDPGAYGNNESAWQIFLFLFFPLVLIGWQYNFRAVVWYSIFSSVLEIVMLHFTNQAVLFGDIAYQRVVFLRTGIFLVAGYVISRVMVQQRQQRQALVEANRQLSHYAATLEQLATTQERNRMARELHDTLAHTLSGLAVQLEAVKALWSTNTDRAQAMLDRSLDDTRVGLTETRRAIQALRANPLEELGLPLAIRQLAEVTADRVGFSLDLKLPVDGRGLGPDVEQCVYRVAQEALENIVKHAEARRVCVQLAPDKGHLILTITDDGQGFVFGDVDAQRQFGLRGLEERARLIGGRLEVDTRPGQGTTVRLTLERADD